MRRRLSLKNLLWVDASAAAFSGSLSALFGGRMAEWFGLPPSLLSTLACISFAYACYSGRLAWRGSRSRAFIVLLICANAGYVVACCFLAAYFLASANNLGITYLLIEAICVAALVFFEGQALKREWSLLH